MSSIVGEPYKNAEGDKSGWFVTDKIFEYLDKSGDVYNKIRYPQPGDPDYIEAEARLRAERMGIFGLPRPFGALILIGGASLLAWGIYKLAK